MTIRKILLTAAAILFSGVLQAQTTYYSDAVNGNDAFNSGKTPSAALQSISKAATLMAKGDTLVVLPGTYNISIEGAFPIQFGNTSTDQSGITIIAAEGPSKTFIDGGGSYDGIGMLRFRDQAKGARITGFTFQNMAVGATNLGFFACAIRLGSSSGNQFSAVGVEIDNCVFASTLARAFVIFGADATTKTTSTGMRIHNNLFLNMEPNRRSVAIYGDGDNHFYNNVILHPTTTTNRAAIYLNALLSHGVPSKAVIKNNIVIGGGGTGTDNSWGIEKAPADATFAGGSLATVEYNNSFGNRANYQGFTPSTTNLSVDPKFVSATNQRLQSTSPMLDAGTTAVPVIRHDLDYYPHLFASTNKGRLPDIGAYESHLGDMTISIPPKLGGFVEFKFTGPAGLAATFLGFNEIAVSGLPFGVVLVDTLFLLGTTSSPGSLKLPVPNVPAAEGVRAVFQGAYSAGGNFELTNVRHTYIRK